MKKVFFIMMFVLISTVVFGQRSLILSDAYNTSEGTYAIAMFYEGKNMGQQLANERIDHPTLTRTPLSSGQSTVINYALKRYQHNVGDTYLFFLNNRLNDITTYVIVEMTSPTSWNYWSYTDIYY